MTHHMDPRHAPDHYVAMVAAYAPLPPAPPGLGPTPAQWSAGIRRVADQIWSDAWSTGYVAGATTRPTVVQVVATPGSPVAAIAAEALARQALAQQTPEGDGKPSKVTDA